MDASSGSPQGDWRPCEGGCEHFAPGRLLTLTGGCRRGRGAIPHQHAHALPADARCGGHDQAVAAGSAGGCVSHPSHCLICLVLDQHGRLRTGDFACGFRSASSCGCWWVWWVLYQRCCISRRKIAKLRPCHRQRSQTVERPWRPSYQVTPPRPPSSESRFGIPPTLTLVVLLLRCCEFRSRRGTQWGGGVPRERTRLV
jgi:hypothetical protein